MKAYWIDATAQTISEVDYAGLSDLQRMAGGYIEIAKAWDSGDVLFVDEEGLLKGTQTFFRIAGREQPMTGNGVVVGPEIGDTAETSAPDITLDQLRAEVTFLTTAQVAALGTGQQQRARGDDLLRGRRRPEGHRPDGRYVRRRPATPQEALRRSTVYTRTTIRIVRYIVALYG